MYIYSITDQRNGKLYIGKCQRESYNSLNYYGSGKIISAIKNKHGLKYFTKNILKDNIVSPIELIDQEIHFIKKMNSLFPNGYNLTEGGEGGDTFSNNPNAQSSMKSRKTPKNTNWEGASPETKIRWRQNISLSQSSRDTKERNAITLQARKTNQENGRVKADEYLYNDWLYAHSAECIEQRNSKMEAKRLKDSRTDEELYNEWLYEKYRSTPEFKEKSKKSKVRKWKETYNSKSPEELKIIKLKEIHTKLNKSTEEKKNLSKKLSTAANLKFSGPEGTKLKLHLSNKATQQNNRMTTQQKQHKSTKCSESSKGRISFVNEEGLVIRIFKNDQRVKKGNWQKGSVIKNDREWLNYEDIQKLFK